MSDTPRTDAQVMYPGSGIVMVRPEFAQQLERENKELLEALKGAVAAWESICSLNNWDADHLAEFKRARAAIAKAEGK
jgi:hypothetical protein